MAILQTFTRTLPTPSATHSDGFVFLLSTGWFTQADGIPRGSPIDGGTYSIANGGGDLQAYSDEACTIRVPVEVVEFVTGGTPSAIVWVRLPTWTAGDKITIAKDDTQTVQPAVTDTYGRNSVWVDYEISVHGGDLVDSTGGVISNDGASLGAKVTPTGVDSIRFDLADRFTANIASLPSYTMELYYNLEARGSSGVDVMVMQTPDDTTATSYIIDDTSPSDIGMFNSTNSWLRSGIGSSINQWYHIVVTGGGGTREIYIDGQLKSSSSLSTESTSRTQLNVGMRRPALTSYNSSKDLGEVKVKATKKSSSLISDEYTNQSDPDNFGTSSEWADFGGGGVSIPVIMNQLRNQGMS